MLDVSIVACISRGDSNGVGEKEANQNEPNLRGRQPWPPPAGRLRVSKGNITEKGSLQDKNLLSLALAWAGHDM
jgi:hypothetical protein